MKHCKYKWMTRLKYKLLVEGWSWSYEVKGSQGETWRRIKIFGVKQEVFGTNSEHDCSGLQFCWGVDEHLFGLITVGYYGIDC